VVLLELAVNDLANVRSDLGVSSSDKDEVVLGLTELLLLLLRQLPRSPGVVYVGASSRGAKASNLHDDPRTGSSIALHARVARLYDAPVVSVTDAIGWPKTEAALEYYWDVFRYHDCCHPTAYGHALVARLVLHAMQLAASGGEAGSLDAVLTPPPAPPPALPSFTSAELAHVYLSSWPLVVTPTLDARDAAWRPEGTPAASGFSMLVEHGDKPGLVAQAAGAEVTYSFGADAVAAHCKAGRLHLTALHSYEGMGVASVAVRDCGDAQLAQKDVDFLWEERYSEAVVTELSFTPPSAGCLLLTVRVTSSRATGNKVKLTTIMLL